MTAFSQAQLAYLLGGRRLGRVATVGRRGPRSRGAIHEPRPLIRIHPERIVSWGLGRD